jgi:hypothetical protein
VRLTRTTANIWPVCSADMPGASPWLVLEALKLPGAAWSSVLERTSGKCSTTARGVMPERARQEKAMRTGTVASDEVMAEVRGKP